MIFTPPRLRRTQAGSEHSPGSTPGPVDRRGRTAKAWQHRSLPWHT
jgi:hypothetical protein